MAKKPFAPFFLEDIDQIQEGDHLRVFYQEPDGPPSVLDGWVYLSSRETWHVIHDGGDWDVELDIIAEGVQAQVIGRRWHGIPKGFIWFPE